MPRLSIPPLAALAAFFIGIADAAAQGTFLPSEPWWGGVHVGVHGGYGWGKNNAAETGAAYNGGPGWGYHTEGLLSGVRAGYDWESTGLILGVEAGLGYLSVEGDGTDPASGGLDTISVLASGAYAELTGRLGFADERWLYYMTAGAAFADLDLSVTDSCGTNPPCSATTIAANSDDIEAGWTAGIGIGHALSESWSAMLEYRYFRFENVTVTGVSSASTTHSWDHDLTINTVTAGLAVRF